MTAKLIGWPAEAGGTERSLAWDWRSEGVVRVTGHGATPERCEEMRSVRGMNLGGAFVTAAALLQLDGRSGWGAMGLANRRRSGRGRPRSRSAARSPRGWQCREAWGVAFQEAVEACLKIPGEGKRVEHRRMDRKSSARMRSRRGDFILGRRPSSLHSKLGRALQFNAESRRETDHGFYPFFRRETVRDICRSGGSGASPRSGARSVVFVTPLGQRCSRASQGFAAGAIDSNFFCHSAASGARPQAA